MPQDTRRFKVGGKIYNIPIDKADDFLSSFEGAQEVSGFQVGDKKYNIPLDKVESFKEQFGDQATPIGVSALEPELEPEKQPTTFFDGVGMFGGSSIGAPVRIAYGEEKAAKLKPTAPENITKSLWNAMRYQLPQTSLMSAAATKELAAERAEIGMNIGFATRLGGSPLSGAVGMAMDDPSTKEEVEEFTDYIRKEVKPKLYTAAIKFQEEGAEYTEGLISSLDKAENWLDYVNWAGYAFGQALGQMPASIATGGATAMLMETGEIYQSGVEKLAEEYGITPLEVIEQGLDDPAVAIAFGASAAALETISGARILTAPMKNAARNSLRRRMVSIIEAGALEATTEGSQSIVEQVGSNIMAGQDWKDIDWEDVYESTMQGLVGGTGISMSGNMINQTLTEGDNKEKLAEKLTEVSGDKHIVTEDNRIWNVDKKKQVKTLEEVRKSEDENAEIDEATSTGNPTRDATISELVDNTFDKLEESEFVPRYVYKGEEISKGDALMKIAEGDVTNLKSINDDDTQKLIDTAQRNRKEKKDASEKQRRTRMKRKKK
jgi:hypothetical protein